MANPFQAIGNFLKKVFGWVIHNSDLQDFVKQYFKSVVQSVVAELAQGNLTNEQKHAAAFSRIEAAAIAGGYKLGQNSIDLLIKLAVANLKGLIGE